MNLKPIDFHEDAAKEVDAAALWYGNQTRVAVRGFIAELDLALAAIQETPERWPAFRFGTRRYLLKRYPFFVVYREQDYLIQVVAVAHGKRRPGYWQERLQP